MSFMRVDERPEVLPERCCGQIIESPHDLSLPLSTVQISLSSNRASERTRDFAAPRPLISRDVLMASCTLAVLCLSQAWVCFLATSTPSLAFLQGGPSGRFFAALLADTALLSGFF